MRHGAVGMKTRRHGKKRGPDAQPEIPARHGAHGVSSRIRQITPPELQYDEQGSGSRKQGHREMDQNRVIIGQYFEHEEILHNQ